MLNRNIQCDNRVAFAVEHPTFAMAIVDLIYSPRSLRQVIPSL